MPPPLAADECDPRQDSSQTKEESMHRLWTTLAIAGLALAVWTVPSLAARQSGHPKTAKKTAYATGTKQTTRKARATMSAADLLRSSLAPSVPADPMIAGAKPGALPWRLKSGDVVISGSHVLLHFTGFLIPGKGVGPVKTVDASLYCDGSTTPAATTAASKLSSLGDATIDAAMTVPKRCLAPLVLVHPNGQAASYVAASGWTR
jgi:hypothetical protein